MRQTVKTLPKGKHMNTKQLHLRDLDTDLASLACHAAIELEGVVLGRATRFEAVEKLATALSGAKIDSTGSVCLDFLHDPSVSLAMHQAIVASSIASETLEEDDQLIEQTGKISAELANFVKRAEAGDKSFHEADKLKQFCLALSSGASLSQESVYED